MIYKTTLSVLLAAPFGSKLRNLAAPRDIILGIIEKDKDNHSRQINSLALGFFIGAYRSGLARHSLAISR